MLHSDLTNSSELKIHQRKKKKKKKGRRLRPHTCYSAIWQKKAQRYQHVDLQSLPYDTCGKGGGKKAVQKLILPQVH